MDFILLGTDVLMDSFFDRKPFSEFSNAVLNLCEENAIKGFTTPLIIANVYYLLRKISRHDIVVEKIKLLLTIIDIIEMDKKTVLFALNSNFSDFEDALQNFSALEYGKIKIILTRNIKDFKKSELVVLSPETYLKGHFNKQ